MSAAVAIDAELARFMTGAVSIIAASRNASNTPSLVRAHGCRIARDRRRMAILLVAGQARELLADVGQNGRIAVVFTRPSTHRSVQVKGDDARVTRLRQDDPARAAGYRDAMVAELALIGVSEARARAVLAAGDALVAVEFTPCAAFVQTPGPDAGRPLQVPA